MSRNEGPLQQLDLELGSVQRGLFPPAPATAGCAVGRPGSPSLAEQLAAFCEFGKPTVCLRTPVFSFAGERLDVPTYVNEFWTARQRQANSLHEVSYRACFKPQLPRFFVERLTAVGAVVYDPFMGRGTTLLEAALLGRVPWGNDVNPLSRVLVAPRLRPPELGAIGSRLREIDFNAPGDAPDELLVFYHPETLRQLAALRRYLLQRSADGTEDAVDGWIRMVAVNRLTGHSAGFFSVYTLPPNQATSVKAQRRINERRSQVPPSRDVPAILLKKSRQLLGDCDARVRSTLGGVADGVRLWTAGAEATPGLPDGSVDLVVTSPPFLNVVQYATDNWLRCWFVGVDAKAVAISTPSQVEAWQGIMRGVFRELARVVRTGGHVAFEVGEVHGGQTRLEEAVVPCALAAGFHPELILINDQAFTKTANCWGVNNNAKGTNTNRVVVLRRP